MTTAEIEETVRELNVNLKTLERTLIEAKALTEQRLAGQQKLLEMELLERVQLTRERDELRAGLANVNTALAHALRNENRLKEAEQDGAAKELEICGIWESVLNRLGPSADEVDASAQVRHLAERTRARLTTPPCLGLTAHDLDALEWTLKDYRNEVQTRRANRADIHMMDRAIAALTELLRLAGRGR